MGNSKIISQRDFIRKKIYVYLYMYVHPVILIPTVLDYFEIFRILPIDTKNTSIPYRERNSDKSVIICAT